MGQVTLTELTFLLVQGRMPSPEETRLLDAVLVSLADHGLTPTVLAARLTYTGAPESLQGAVAAGLLGAGSVFLGVVEDTARFLDEIGDDVEGRRRGGARGWAADSGPRSPGPQGPGPAHAAHLRDRGGDRPARAPPAAAAGGRRGAPQADRPRAADQRRGRGRRGARRPRLPGGRSYAVSRCWRAPRGCSATSRRRWSTRWGCLSTARWMSVRSTTRRLGSNGGGTATSEGRQAASTVPGGDAHAASPRALGPAECPCART